jgi:hypothetical protein
MATVVTPHILINTAEDPKSLDRKLSTNQLPINT